MIRTLAWLIGSVVLGLLALAPAFIVGGMAAGLALHSDVVRLALTAAVWALIAGGMSVALAHLLLIARRSGEAQYVAVVLVAGALASAVATGGVVFWMVDHYGMIQSEVAQLAYLMPIAVTLLTSGTAAALTTTGAARTIALATVVVGTALLVLAAASNLPGIGDGMSPSGPALVLSFAAAGGYALLANYLLLRAGRGSAG